VNRSLRLLRLPPRNKSAAKLGFLFDLAKGCGEKNASNSFFFRVGFLFAFRVACLLYAGAG